MKTIRWMGDSTTIGATVLPGEKWLVAPDNTMATATRLLKEKFGESAISSFNDGASSSAIIDWYAGSAATPNKPLMPSLAQRMTTPEYQAMSIGVLEIGINDATKSTTTADFGWYLQKIRETFNQHGKTLVIATPNPINHPNLPQLHNLQIAIKSFASWFSVPLIDHYGTIISMPNWRSLMADNGHPTNTLYSVKGALAACALDGLISPIPLHT